MNFEVQKIRNCFVEAATYEYRLPICGAALVSYLVGWEINENHQIRRPVFSAKKNGIEIKGILAENIVKINYAALAWEEQKKEVEAWLKEQLP